jgi:hypothetical protein
VAQLTAFGNWTGAELGRPCPGRASADPDT